MFPPGRPGIGLIVSQILPGERAIARRVPLQADSVIALHDASAPIESPPRYAWVSATSKACLLAYAAEIAFALTAAGFLPWSC